MEPPSCSQAPNSSSWTFCSNSETRPSIGEFGQSQTSSPLSLWPPSSCHNCPAAKCALRGLGWALSTSIASDSLCIPAFRVHVCGPFMAAFKPSTSPTAIVGGQPDGAIGQLPALEVSATLVLWGHRQVDQFMTKSGHDCFPHTFSRYKTVWVTSGYSRLSSPHYYYYY